MAKIIIDGQEVEVGINGEDGEGVPVGGTTGQILTKYSDVDYDTTWSDMPTIPGKLSQLTNDEGFVTDNEVDNKLSNYATTAEVDEKVSAMGATIIGGAPEDYDTLKEVYDYISSDQSAMEALNSAIANKVDKTTTVNGKALSNSITLSANDIGARPDTWVPTAEEVGARPITWTPTASEVGALPSDGTAVAADKLATAHTIDGIEFDGTSDITHFGICNTAADVAKKVVSIPGFVLFHGATVTIEFMDTNTANDPMLNVNNTGDIYMRLFIDTALPLSLWKKRSILTLVYNGSFWMITSITGRASTLYYGITKLDSAIDSTLQNVAATPYAVKQAYDKAVEVQNSIPQAILNFFGLSSALSENSWEAIDRASKLGIADKLWSVGDEIDIQIGTMLNTLAGTIDFPSISTQTITLQIYGFNHDDLTSGGKVGITFGMKNLLAETAAMNSSNTNVGGFTGSDMYDWLQNTVLPTLPTDLQSVIKHVNKKTNAGNQSTVINTDSMKLFLFSCVETGLRTTQAIYKDEGTQYSIFTNDASRIKRLANGTGSAKYWWERSPRENNLTTFNIVHTIGYSDGYAASTSLGVCFGFCV